MGRARAGKGAVVGVETPLVAALDRLEARYGEQRLDRDLDPVEELVSCILSQHTSDSNSFPAFYRLRARYPGWQQVVDAGEGRVSDVVRSAGLANQKAKSIIATLKEVHKRNGEYSLENLRSMTLQEARKWLEALPGVGPKTASIVLCFSFGMGAIPVDTHIFRVSKRLGFIGEKVSADRAHDILLDLVPQEDALRYHMLLIRHGRETCKAQRPLCGSCPVYDICVFKGKSKR